MKWKFEKQEFGRSMVEMLGVLAIIGVLTIGALAGFRYAKDKNIANTITHEVQLRAVTASTQLTMGNSINLSEFEDKIYGEYTVSVEESEDKQWFTLYVSDVPKGPLKQMISGLFGGLHYWAVGVNSENNGAMAEGRHILASQETGNVLIKSALADIGETNTVWFEFKKDVKAAPEIPTDNLKKLGTEYSRCYYRE